MEVEMTTNDEMTFKNPLSKLFELGQTVITRNAKERLNPADVLKALNRHRVGDWGNLSESDIEENHISLQEGFRLLSAYVDRHGAKFWIITEADRSVTTILLPEDY